jgi:MtfA peptidase
LDMLSAWMQRLRVKREQRAVARRPIPDDLWKRTLIRLPFLQRRDAGDAAALRHLTSLFLDRKEFTGAAGLQLRDAMVVAIAAQAVLPVLKLGLARYDRFVGLVVHPGPVKARRNVTDDDGLVHEFDEVLSGEAMQGGPVMLSWHDVGTAGRSAALAYNVVIHEFAHVLDMAAGPADGTPVLPPHIGADEWRSTLAAEHRAFVQRVEQAQDTALDPYGSHSVEEFFAVATEAFFVSPDRMLQEHPALYALFMRFYAQDPVRDTPTRRPAR